MRNIYTVENSSESSVIRGRSNVATFHSKLFILHFVIALRVEQLAVGDGEDDAEELRRGVQQARRRALRLGIGDFGGKLEPDRQVAGHEEAKEAGRDVHHADVAHRQGERVGDHAAHAQGVHGECGAPAGTDRGQRSALGEVGQLWCVVEWGGYHHLGDTHPNGRWG